MAERRQEKLGWIGGWLGGFVWVPIVAGLMLAHGRSTEGIVGLAIVAAACAIVFVVSPWRYPKTRYRVLLAPIYVLFFAAVGWGIWAFGGPRQMGFNSWWALSLLLPTLIPLWVVGERRWDDGGAEPPG